MAGLCWMAVALVLSLSAGNSLAVVDQNELATIVFNIVPRYRPYYKFNDEWELPMFSLAVSVPCNSESSKCDINQVFKTDSTDVVRNKILDCDVYTGTRMVAATLLRWDNVLKQCPDKPVQWKDVLTECDQKSMTWADLGSILQDRSTKQQCRDLVWEGRADHAEYRTLQDNIFNNLVNNHNKEDLLLFYVFASPCDRKCASNGPFGILKSIEKIKKWKNYALVFSKAFRPRGGKPVPEGNCRALEKLGQSIDLKNIFRCNIEGTPKCTSCSAGNRVNPYCFADDSQSGSNLPQRGRSDYRSQSGDRHRHKDKKKCVDSKKGEIWGSWGRSGRVSKHRAVGKSRRWSKDRRDNRSMDRSEIRRVSRKRKRSKDRRDNRSRDRSEIRGDSSSRGGGRYRGYSG